MIPTNETPRPGTAIGTAYRRLVNCAHNELNGCSEGDRVYDMDAAGDTRPVSDAFDGLFSAVLPEALVGNARFGIEGGVRFASADFRFAPFQRLRATEPSGPGREFRLEIELPMAGEPRITVGYASKDERVRMYPEDLGTLRETLLASFEF